jgi:hypothetical protein
MASVSITASTANLAQPYRSDDAKSLFEDGKNVNYSNLTCNIGDFIYIDTVANEINLVAATANGQYVIGQSQVALQNGVLVGPYNGLATPQALSDFQGPVYGVAANVILTAGEAYAPGTLVYLSGTSSQQVTITDGVGSGYFVGVYVGPAIASATAGQVGQVKTVCRYPAVSY